MKQASILLLFLIFTIGCAKKSEYLYGQFNPSNIKEQVFRVKLNADTTLKTKAGVLLKISAKTFQNTNLEEVEIKVKEIISKEELLKSGIPTVDNTGRLLESGGMINIQTNPRLDINPNNPIHASIPAVGANLKMKKYVADIENGDFLWKYVSPLSHNLDFNNLLQGEQLFIQHCTSCHDKNLEKKLTGPALGCIEIGENSRDRDWLIKFTKNSQKMIAEGDKLAICNWNTYRPTIMTNFEFLSDAQINQIYNYINNESIRKDICHKGEISGRNYFDVATCDSRIDSSSNPNYAPIITTYYYGFSISDYKWINCDCNPFDEQEAVNPFNIIAEKDLEIFLIFKNRKSLWPFCEWEDHYVLIETEDEKKVNLPVGEPVTIFAFGKSKNGHRNICEIETTIKQNNDMTLTMKDVTDDAFNKVLQKYK
jgi:mono/diheme cytochrome c family protein